MAERPIFVPSLRGDYLVQEVSLQLKWNPGFAVVQKEKNVVALHNAATAAGFAPVLEVSTKSLSNHGRRLSAFSLRIKSESLGELPLESAFQGSKVFERGGPYNDLYLAEPRNAKRDPRLRDSGQLKGFLFDGLHWGTEPKTAFYDWLYATFLSGWRDWATKLSRYAAFTDIEFNPQRSINCQARSLALFVALNERGLLDEAVSSPAAFTRLLIRFNYHPGVSGRDSLLFT